VSRSALAQVMQMALSGTTLVTYLPNLNNNPMGANLLGYPIVVCDFLNALGSESDFALINPAFYALGLRQALTVESSIHYAFVDDVTTYRFVARAGGIPIPDGTYAYRSVASSKVNEHSPFVTLDDVVAS
jgi:HK97 family phage major capsid protein